ncbi:MAG TPA: phosphatase PAP2 family protein [Thermoanaerobaculia bacterium]|nr:phosphatase PAP2 family protein [Thermoanaerobaculia bacterium]
MRPTPPTPAIRPVEALNFFALILLSAATVLLRDRLPDPAGTELRYAIMAAALLLVTFAARRMDRLPAWARFLVDFYPAAFIPVLYETLGPLIAAARGRAQDAVLIAADRALFGTDVTVWMQRWVRPPLTDLFYLSYTTYYFIALALGFVLWRRSPPDLRRFIFSLTLCYYVSYAGYFAVPALGPRYALAGSHTVVLETTPISTTIERTLNELEHTKYDVFPSGHTMIAVAVLLVAFRRARDVFWILLPIATLLVISTVYCRYHYVIDVIAGIVLAVATVPIGNGLYDRLTSRSPQRANS